MSLSNCKPRTGHVSRATGGRACGLHVAKCQASKQSVPVGWGHADADLFLLLWPWMGRPPSHCPAQVPARTYLQYLHMHRVCVGSHGTIESHLYQGSQCSTHIASIRKLPVVAGCCCLFFGSRVAACGIHATADEENRPGQPMQMQS